MDQAARRCAVWIVRENIVPLHLEQKQREKPDYSWELKNQLWFPKLNAIFDPPSYAPFWFEIARFHEGQICPPTIKHKALDVLLQTFIASGLSWGCFLF